MLTTVSAIIVSESVRMISVISGVGGRGNNHDGAAVGGGGDIKYRYTKSRAWGELSTSSAAQIVSAATQHCGPGPGF